MFEMERRGVRVPVALMAQPVDIVRDLMSDISLIEARRLARMECIKILEEQQGSSTIRVSGYVKQQQSHKRNNVARRSMGQ